MFARTATIMILSVVVSPAADRDIGKRIDVIFEEWNKTGTAGAAVAVIQAGKLIYDKGYGSANLEYEIPITAETVFHVASVSKQFTAMAVVLLEQQRKLSLDDDIRKYVPELPDYGQKITIRNLLQHTGGIRDQWQALALAGWRLDDVITQQQILRVLFRQKELNFKPGTEHLYSNGGYSLAAEIVARVSGKPFAIFCDEQMFQPIGMTRTHFHDDHRRIVPNRAYSYSKTPTGFRSAPLNYSNVGATSLFTTALDLTKWLDNFRDPKVGGRAGIDRLEEQAMLANRERIGYALGVGIGKYRGSRTISHGGADAGYRSLVSYFPEEQLGIVILSNLASFSPGAYANKVADLFLDGKPGPVNQTTNSASGAGDGTSRKAFDAEDLPDYAGPWWSDELETQYTIRLNGDSLIAEHVRHGDIALRPAGKDFFSGSEWFFSQVRFERDSTGKPAAMIVGGGRVRGVKFTRR
jgi:CubicO group peptidase (beta-lactamase class C family)